MDHLGFKLARAALQDVAGNQSVTENENAPDWFRSVLPYYVRFLAALGKQAVEKRAVEDDAHQQAVDQSMVRTGRELP